MGKIAKIDGMGNVNNGEYDLVEVNGMGNLYGKIISKRFIINGRAKSNGDIEAEDFNLDGRLVNKGNLKIREGRINGFLTNENNIFADNLEVNGRLISGNIECNDIKVNGEIKIQENCQSESFVSKGRLVIGGLLSGENIEIIDPLDSKIKEIGGTSIIIKKRNNNFFEKLLFWKESNIEVETIEADYIFLENTSCDVVRARKVEIGVGCNINRIEYVEDIIISKNSKVKESLKG